MRWLALRTICEREKKKTLLCRPKANKYESHDNSMKLDYGAFFA